MYVVVTKIGHVYGPFVEEQIGIDWAKLNLAPHKWWVSYVTTIETPAL